MQACRSARLTILLALIPFGSILPATQNSAPSQKPQEKPYALIFGTVWGPDDHPVYGVKVKIRRADAKKPHWELYSNHSGEFAQRVPAGKADYVIETDLKGVKSVDGRRLQAEAVTVHVDNDERVDTSVHLK
jgi:hypothetical protein